MSILLVRVSVSHGNVHCSEGLRLASSSTQMCLSQSNHSGQKWWVPVVLDTRDAETVVVDACGPGYSGH